MLFTWERLTVNPHMRDQTLKKMEETPGAPPLLCGFTVTPPKAEVSVQRWRCSGLPRLWQSGSQINCLSLSCSSSQHPSDVISVGVAPCWTHLVWFERAGSGVSMLLIEVTDSKIVFKCNKGFLQLQTTWKPHWPTHARAHTRTGRGRSLEFPPEVPVSEFRLLRW